MGKKIQELSLAGWEDLEEVVEELEGGVGVGAGGRGEGVAMGRALAKVVGWVLCDSRD